MPFDVFALRDRVVGEYREYFESFVHIFDRRVEAFVRDKLAEGELWPDAVLQLNPAYAPARPWAISRGTARSRRRRRATSALRFACTGISTRRSRLPGAASPTSSRPAPGRARA
jgi:hypothetical protein